MGLQQQVAMVCHEVYVVMDEASSTKRFTNKQYPMNVERERERIAKIKNEHEVFKRDYLNRIEKILKSEIYGVFKSG
jgi:hypothetical protein